MIRKVIGGGDFSSSTSIFPLTFPLQEYFSVYKNFPLGYSLCMNLFSHYFTLHDFFFFLLFVPPPPAPPIAFLMVLPQGTDHYFFGGGGIKFFSRQTIFFCVVVCANDGLHLPADNFFVCPASSLGWFQ